MPAEGPASFRSGEVLSSLVNYLSHPGPRDKFNEFASSFVDCAIERAKEGVVTVGESRPIQRDCTKFQRDSPSRLFVSEINGIRAGFIRLALARVMRVIACSCVQLLRYY